MSERKFARREFIKRSATVTTALTSASSSFTAQPTAQSQTAETSQACSLKDFDVRNRQLDTLHFSSALYKGIKPSMSFSATNRRAALLWQKKVRERLIDLVGGFPVQRVALRPKVLEKKEFNDYTREKVIFQSRDNLTVFGYLLLPKNYSAPGPCVICLPGHGRGCDDIVGIAANGTQRQALGGYQKDFALQAAQNGFAALAIEQLAFGCRRDAAASKKGAEQSSCQPAAGAALLFGQTMIGWRVWDVIRAIDYLHTRPEIDAQRIATMGISGGGTASFFSAAFDERIKVSVVSGYFNTFRDSIMSLSHCIDNYVPGILNYVEMYDIAGLIAPRALFVESGTRDNIFPIEAAKLAFEKASRIYNVFGVREKLDREIFEDEHVFYGKGAFQFLKTRL